MKEPRLYIGILQLVFAGLGFFLNVKDGNTGFDFVTAAVALKGGFDIIKGYRDHKESLKCKGTGVHIITGPE